MRQPNAEQKVAIEHHGGVLLSAGAGSGKTFVLVEHIIYLVGKFIDENKGLSTDDLLIKMKSHFASIVLMTFTKKAAGELSLRLQKRIEIQIDQGEEWRVALEAINSIFVGTIHGFCNRLIRQGFFLESSPNDELVSEMHFAGALEKIFDRWYITRCKKDFLGLVPIFSGNKKSILSSVIKIFNDPGLRAAWSDIVVDEMVEIDFKSFVRDYFDASGLVDLNRTSNLLASFHNESKKKWYQLLQNFSLLSPIVDRQTYLEALEFFVQNKTLRGPQKGKGFDEVVAHFDLIKALRKFLRDNEESILGYFKFKNDNYKEWCLALKNLVSFIEENYSDVGGMTFTDLEYIVLRGCENEESIQRIQEAYRYFIVDEFQDTSSVQYQILKKIAGNDLNKIFCVGDVKQAIYGFRGGELGVFLSCQQDVARNLTMTNNYRSCEKVINFNNQFFDALFRKGSGYAGADLHRVEVHHQTVPLKREFDGLIHKDKVTVSDQDKISSGELSQIEAHFLYKRIQLLREEYPEDDVCVLYRKLGPAKELLSLFLENDDQFNVQVKVPLGEDPVISICARLLEEKFEKNPSRALTHLLLKGYFTILSFDIPDDWDDVIEMFYCNLDTVGIVESYRKFLYSLGISNSNYRNNLRSLESIEKISNGQIELFWSYLKNSFEQSYSIDFQKGENSGRIKVMTAHASKGLEFDHVLLGGIHNNAVAMADRSYVGQLPGSFRWKGESGQRKAFKSLPFILEQEIQNQKDFSESKRLFYVAATRAVKSLSWIDIHAQDKACSLGKNSWINGLRALEDLFICNTTNTSCDFSSLKKSVVSLPLFHGDQIGLVQSEISSEKKLLTISELSVTRLATIVDCPRKFYLKNVCKIEIEDIEDEKEFKEDQLFDEMGSSARRGTEIHEHISKIVETKSLQGLDQLQDRDKKSIEWIFDELAPMFGSNNFISEVPMKFSIFGLMVTGIPDLVIQGEDECQVWDYKTGRFSEEKSRPYWFQLMVYGYAIAQKFGLKKEDEITLVLSFLDERKHYKKKISYREILQQLKSHWNKLAHLYQVNREHCSSCQFSSLCKQ